MNCQKCTNMLVEYIEKTLPKEQRQALEEHLETCPPCRAQMEQLKDLTERLTTNAKQVRETSLESNVINRILQKQSLKLKQTKTNLKLWRIIMKTKLTKLATAASIVLIAALLITFFEKTTTMAYALPQTVEANHSVRFIHIRDLKAGEEEPKEFWVECDSLGQISSARMHIPEWDSPEDGAKIIVWKKDKVQVYFKRKNLLFIAGDKTVAVRMLSLVEECDPRLAVEHMLELEAKGEVKIEINEPSDRAELIMVTATYLPESSTPEKRQVLFVDQATKLVTSMEFYELRDDDYEYKGVMDFLDYNQEIEAKMFVLDVPADAMRIDQTAQEVGLLQGDLSNDQIALEVVRQFFEALMVRDYGKAGTLMEGIPADRMQQGFGHMKVLRIISVGPVAPHPKPETKGVIVLCTVEIEKDGKVSEWKLEQLGVRQVFNQPGRWTIFGGI